LAKLVGTDTTIANIANNFLATLAAENHTSKAQAQILLARKLAERQRILEPNVLRFGFILSKLWLGAPWGMGALSRILLM